MAKEIRRVVGGIQYKRCSKCHEWIPYNGFAKSKANYIDGLLDQCKECRKKHYQANREAYIQRSKEYKKQHPQETAQYRLDYAKSHREKENQWHKRFREKFPHIKKQHNRNTNYARREQTAHSVVTTQEWLQLVTELDNMCAYCGRSFPVEQLTMDHIVPLSQGGSNTIDNIFPACLSCNCAKGSMSLEDYLIKRRECLE